MKKLIFIITIAFVLFGSVTAFSYDVPETLRIGLEYKYKNASTIPISNTAIELGSGQNGNFFYETELTSSAGFTIAFADKTIIETNEFYATYENALMGCADMEDLWGYKAVPAYLSRKTWGVYIYGIPFADADKVASNVEGSIINTNLI
ncbi:MAG: hypothetical protein ACRCW1_01440, partial [Anaerotignaceae bacterium]